MKLTDENLDYMDCRPLNPNTGIKGPPWLEKMVADRKAAQEKALSEKRLLEAAAEAAE